jgi:hypothetical protein
MEQLDQEEVSAFYFYYKTSEISFYIFFKLGTTYKKSFIAFSLTSFFQNSYMYYTFSNLDFSILKFSSKVFTKKTFF